MDNTWHPRGLFQHLIKEKHQRIAFLVEDTLVNAGSAWAIGLLKERPFMIYTIQAWSFDLREMYSIQIPAPLITRFEEDILGDHRLIEENQTESVKPLPS